MVETAHTPAAPPRWRRWAGNFYVQLAAAYAVVAAAVYLRAFPFRSHYGGKIWLTPLNAYWDPRFTPWAVVAAVAVAVAVLLAVWGVRTRRLWLPILSAALGIAAVNFAPGGGRAFPFRWLERTLFDTRLLFRAPDVFAGYVEATRAASCHCRTRPGLLYWVLGALDRVFVQNVYAIEIVIAAAAVASVLLLYFGTRAVADKDSGLAAAGLFAVAPALLIFGPGLDGVNCLIGTAVIVAALKAATSERPWPWSVAAGVLLAIAVTTSYLLIVTAAFAAAFLLAGALVTRRWLRAAATVIVMAAAAAATLAAFQAATGYDHIAVFKRAYWANQALPSAGANVIKLIVRAFGAGGEAAVERAQRSYGIFVIGNLYATFFAMGVPAAVLYFREIRTVIFEKELRRSPYGVTAIAFLIVFLAYNFSGLVLGEVERVWLFLIPGFLVPAAVQLTRMARGPYGPKVLTVTLALCGAQALLYNILLLTPF